MRKWTEMIIFPFLLILLSEKVSARDEGLFGNLLFEEKVDEAQCDRMQMEISAADSAMSIDRVPKLIGKWVSQDCEVRPGPEFVIRSYTFMKNNSFRLLQHFYEDESCTLPSHTIVAKGSLNVKEPSWVTPSATDFDYSLSRVTIIPHTTEAAEKLSQENNRECSRGAKKTWQPHRERVVYNRPVGSERSSKSRRKFGRYKGRRRRIGKNVDCLSAMGLNFNELKLIRSQWRETEGNDKNRELLLGDIHSRKKLDYKPTAFQVPLLEKNHARDCINCRVIAKGTERSPPYLISKPQLPPLPHGQWISLRCEVRPLGMFLTRRLSFDSRDRTWMAEYKFHADPICKESSFAISASGQYFIGPVQNKGKTLKKRKTGTNLVLNVEEASLTLFDATLRDTFNAETDCGIGLWHVGIPKDLSPTSGCSILGISLPNTEYDLINLEIDRTGTPLLLLGLEDTDGKKRSFNERPTSYQAPLGQCSVFPQKNNFDNRLEPISNARISISQSSSASRHFFVFTFAIVIFPLGKSIFSVY